MALIERRYAQALVDISLQNNAVDTYQQELHAVVNIFEEHEDLRLFLLNPEIRVDAKKSVITGLFSEKLQTRLFNFLMLVLDKDRFALLPGILKEYIDLADKMKNVISIVIVSAVPLNDLQVEKIKGKYAAMYNAASVKAEVEIDTSLIGGVKVRLGDKVEDGSLRGRLESLKQLIMKS